MSNPVLDRKAICILIIFYGTGLVTLCSFSGVAFRFKCLTLVSFYLQLFVAFKHLRKSFTCFQLFKLFISTSILII